MRRVSAPGSAGRSKLQLGVAWLVATLLAGVVLMNKQNILLSMRRGDTITAEFSSRYKLAPRRLQGRGGRREGRPDHRGARTRRRRGGGRDEARQGNPRRPRLAAEGRHPPGHLPRRPRVVGLRRADAGRRRRALRRRPHPEGPHPGAGRVRPGERGAPGHRPPGAADDRGRPRRRAGQRREGSARRRPGRRPAGAGPDRPGARRDGRERGRRPAPPGRPPVPGGGRPHRHRRRDRVGGRRPRHRGVHAGRPGPGAGTVHGHHAGHAAGGPGRPDRPRRHPGPAPGHRPRGPARRSPGSPSCSASCRPSSRRQLRCWPTCGRWWPT